MTIVDLYTHEGLEIVRGWLEGSGAFDDLNYDHPFLRKLAQEGEEEKRWAAARAAFMAPISGTIVYGAVPW